MTDMNNQPQVMTDMNNQSNTMSNTNLERSHDDFEKAGIGKPVAGRLPDDNIVYKLSGDVLRLESEKSKHPEFWCDIRVQEFTKKRTRDSELVCVVLNQPETEYDGSFTGDVDTSVGTITEEELREKFKIDLKKSHSIVNGDTNLYKPLVNAFAKLSNSQEGPYSKVLIINIENDGEPDSDYERERALDSDDESLREISFVV